MNFLPLELHELAAKEQVCKQGALASSTDMNESLLRSIGLGHHKTYMHCHVRRSEELIVLRTHKTFCGTNVTSTTIRLALPGAGELDNRDAPSWFSFGALC